MNGGGAEKLLLRYIDILCSTGRYKICLFIVQGYGPLMASLPSDVSIYVGSNLSVAQAKEFDNLRFDIEIAFLEGLACKFVALRNSSACKIGWIHTDISNNNWCESYYRLWNQEELYGRLDYIVCVNDFCREQFVKTFPALGNKLLVCNNVLDFSALDKAKLERAQKHDASEFNICFVGRLVSEKNPQLVVYAMNELKTHNSNVHLSIIGEGYLSDDISDYIRKNDLESRISLYGYVSNPYSLMADCDLLISMSDVEGGPLALAEAYYMNIPALASHSGGSDDFARKYGGIKFVEKDVRSLTEAIDNLLSDNFRDYSLLKNEINPNLILHDYSPNSVIELLENII